MRRGLVAVPVLALALAACGGTGRTAPSPSSSDTQGLPLYVIDSPTPTTSPTPTPTASPVPTAAGPLAGKVVVLDPGHNPGDLTHLAQADALVDVVTGRKACDATGASTDGGYPESAFTDDVATRTAAILRARGATVVLTRGADTPAYGPCVTERAVIGNRAHADAAVSIHADGGPPSGVGFHVLLPGPVGPDDAIVGASERLGAALHASFRADTGEPYATYLGGGSGYLTRTDLGGLNLSTVPKVFVECANMRNPTDAARVTSPAWRHTAAMGIADGITAYLRG